MMLVRMSQWTRFMGHNSGKHSILRQRCGHNICLCERLTVLEECTGLFVGAGAESIVAASKRADDWGAMKICSCMRAAKSNRQYNDV